MSTSRNTAPPSRRSEQFCIEFKPDRLLGILLLCLLLLGCETSSQPGLNSRAIPADASVLRVGITPLSPPMAFKQQGQSVGVEADLAQALAADLGRQLRFVELKWEDQVPALVDNRIDIIMSGMTITPTRGVRARFSDSYLEVGQMALVRRDDLHRYALGFPQPLPGKVGVQKNTTGDFLVQNQFRREDRIAYDSVDKAVRALVAGKIALVIHDSTVVWWKASENETQGLAVVSYPLSREPLGWAVNPGNDGLLLQVNDYLKRIRANGQLQSIVRKWLPWVK